MKKLFTLVCGLAAFAFAHAQSPKLTFVLNDSTFTGTMGTGGVHIAGDFTTAGSMTVPNWSPGAKAGAAVSLGNNRYSVQINDLTPDSNLLYKWINDSVWSTGLDEGHGGVTLLDTSCASGTAGGPFNRKLKVPTYNAVIYMVFDRCSGYKLKNTTNINIVPSDIVGLNVYPNPAVYDTRITYTLQNNSNVHIFVTDLLGNIVSEVTNGSQASGVHYITYNTSNLSNGMYLVNIQANEGTVTRKLTVSK